MEQVQNVLWKYQFNKVVLQAEILLKNLKNVIDQTHANVTFIVTFYCSTNGYNKLKVERERALLQGCAIL